MHILVTGATGFLGGRLVKELASYDQVARITATGRTLLPNNKVAAPKVQYLLGDLTNKPFVQSLFNIPIDIVVNCASLSSPWGTHDTFYRANCITQQHLIESSQKAKIKRFIYISTPSIYFNFKDALGIKENDPVPEKMVNSYAATKWKAEQLLKSAGLTYITLRPRALIGAGDTVIMPRLVRSYREGKLKIMGNGNNTVDLTPVSSMVQAIWLAIITDEKNCNDIYNISNGEPVNLWESINYVLSEMGHTIIQKKLPYSLLYAVASFMEWKARTFKLKQEPVLTKYSVGILTKSFTFNIEKAQRKLGYQPKQSTREAIDEFVAWYQSQRA